MSLSFKLARVIDVSSGLSADANPNATNPAAADVFPLQLRASGQSADDATRSVLIYIRGVTASTGAEVPAATTTFTVWSKDQGASASTSARKIAKSRWAGGASHAAVPSSQIVQEKILGDLFVQVTAASLGAATSLEVWIAESPTT